MSTAEAPPTTETASTGTSNLKVIQDATCTFCGCVCDDMQLTVEGDKIVKAKNAMRFGGRHGFLIITLKIDRKPRLKASLQVTMKPSKPLPTYCLTPNTP